MNPLVPVGWDILWGLLTVASILFALIALALLFRTRTAVGPSTALIWAMAILLFPVLGSAAWLIASRGLRQSMARERTFAANAGSR